MMSRFSRTLARIATIASALVLAACPLPIGRTETISAPMVGTILWADGTPASGLEVGVSTGWSDDVCTRTLARSRTDQSGAFQLPGTEKHYSTTWFIPNLDPGVPSFRLCAAAGDTLRRAYVGHGSLRPMAETDTVACIAWEWNAGPRVSCVGRAEHAIVTGGAWTDSTAGSAGFYRLFLTEEPTRVKGADKDKPQDRPHAYVQWLEPRAPGASPGSAPWRVRATASLDFDRDKVYAAHEVQLWRREGRWLASVHGFRNDFMRGTSSVELVFELGPPGVVKKVAGP
jgi:hypothetical protein